LASDEVEPGPKSELLIRIVSAAILAPVAIGAVIVGDVPFALLVSVVAAIAFLEWTAIGRAEQPSWARMVAGVALVTGLFGLGVLGANWIVVTGAVAVLAILAGRGRPAFRWMGLGLVYVAVPSAAVLLLRQAEPYGLMSILFILVVVWATDISAYFGGRAMGGPKLWPKVSPKKTWSGAVSGLAAACLAGGAMVAMMQNDDFLIGLLLAIPLSVAAQAGDLFESAVKREFGVKDSGKLIPGHGGVLDRVDGLFGASAVAWLLALLGLGGTTLSVPGTFVPIAAGGS
jgi:phosphatidate cytidylyltransferase